MEDFRGKEFSEEEWWKIWEEDSDFRISGACSVLDDLFTEMWNEGWFANIQEGTNTCYEFLGRHKKEPLPEKVEGASYNMGVDDLENADELIERILFLEGLPNLQDIGKLFIGENVPEMLKNDLMIEQKAHSYLLEGVKYCESSSDFVTRELFDKILEDEESHIDWLETQLDLIDNVGLQNYSQSMM